MIPLLNAFKLSRSLAIGLLAASFTLAGCGGRSFHAPTAAQQAAAQAKNAGNFTRTYFIGDSITAGFQNGSLLDTQQPHGYANLIATQAQFPITLPLIAPPGAPAVLQLVSLGPPPVITPVAGTTAGRDNPQVQATDLAVPGHTVQDVISNRPSATPQTAEEQITTLVLGEPSLALNLSRSQLDWANALAPTTVFVWIGNNDALIADFTGMPSSMTSVSAFTASYTQLIQSLQQNTTAHLVIANIPDVTSVPYLTPAPVVIAEVAAQTKLPPATVGALLGIQAGDLVNPTGLAEIPNVLAGKQKGLDDAGVLTAAEVVLVQQQVAQYNQVIAQEAQAANATLVDVNALFAKLPTGAIVVNGVPITNQFLGGAIGLDGIHPTNTGYAILANFFIDTMNASFKSSVPDVDVSSIANVDPLFPPNLLKGHSQGAHVSVQAGRALDPLFKR